MQRLYILIAFLIFSGPTILAKQIPTKKIDTYAKAAFLHYTNTKQSLSEIKIKETYTQQKDGYVFYHIINFEEGGFVILSGDTDYDAILGFSDEGRIAFEEDARNEGLWGELMKHEDSMQRVFSGEFKSLPLVSKQWQKLDRLADADNRLKSISFNPVVGPLTTTEWNQSGWYNDHTPADSTGPGGTTYAGCVPIAVAQTLRYYENPIPGAGSISYNDPLYGTQSADFCGQQFDWDNMPDVLDEHNPTTSKFIYEVGVSMETHYSNDYTGTFTYKIPDAMIYNFGFDQDMKSFVGVNHQRYSETLRTEFDAGRIVIFGAWSVDENDFADIGHCWISDGYGYTDDNVEYMHMNWGWGGNDNGWFIDPNAWVPHIDNIDQDTIPYFWYRTTFYNIKPAQEFCPSPDSKFIEIGAYDDYVWAYNWRSIDELVKFRYRVQGDSDWTETEPTFEFSTHVQNLKPGTTYEYETARNCCGTWSDYSNTAQFSTLGSDPGSDPVDDNDCQKEVSSDLSTSSVSDDFAYVYTSYPNGQVNNQFRYRVVNTTEWIETEENNIHYRALRGLSSGTTYEYQVNHECSADKWSGYGESYIFTTTGESTDDDDTDDDDTDDDDTDDGDSDPNCFKEDPSEMFTTSVSDNFAYVYTVYPNGQVDNQFRYRNVGSDTWVSTDDSDLHYRALRNLSSGTVYEYQVNHQCGTDSFSGWSDSHSFTTTGESTEDPDDEETDDEETENETMSIDPNCEKESTGEMSTSSVSDNFAYVYTAYPNGQVNNLFRYRVVGAATWTLTNEDDLHYRALRSLTSQTTYEYQVNHQCSDSGWSGWSDSYVFTTLSSLVGDAIALRSGEDPDPLPLRNMIDDITVFPNPSADYINVSLEDNSAAINKSKCSVEIIDQTGRAISKIQMGDQNLVRLNINDLSSGMYIIRITDQDGLRGVSRFMKI